MKLNESRVKWLMLAICCVIVFINAGIRMSFGVFFKPLQAVLGVSRHHLSLVQSSFELGFGLFQLVMGRIVDIGGPKRVMTAGLLVLTVSFWLISSNQTMWLLILAYGILIAFGAGSTSLVATIALARKWFRLNSTMAISLITVSVSLGQLFLIPVISLIVSGFGLTSGYRYLSLLAFFTLILVLVGLRTPISFGVKHAAGQSVPGLINYSQFCGSRSFWIFGFAFMICGFGFSFIATHLIPFAIDEHLLVSQASNALAMIGGASVIGTLGVSYISHYFSKQKTTFLLFAVRALAMILLLKSVSLYSIYLFAVIIGFTWTATVPLITGLSSERFGANNTGTVLGALFLLHQIGAAAGSYTGGLVADYTHGYHTMFIMSALLDLAAALVILTYKSSAKVSEPSEVTSSC